MRFERGDLSIDRPGDVEPDVRVARPEEEHARHAMVLQAAGELLGEEEVIARRDDAVESAPPGDAMVRVHLVVAPGVVREDDVGPVLADDAAYLAAKIHADLELAILVAEENELLDADRFAGRALLALSRLGHLLGGCLQIVRAFLPAGDHAVGDMRAGRPDPRGESARASEIHVVGMSEDRHRALRNGEDVRHVTLTLRSSSTRS